LRLKQIALTNETFVILTSCNPHATLFAGVLAIISAVTTSSLSGL